jgi:hypothetical protein
VVKDASGRPAVRFKFDEVGWEGMAAITGTAHIGLSMAIVLNGKVISAPRIESRISTEGMITGTFSQGKAEQIANILRQNMLADKTTEDMSPKKIDASPEGQEQENGRELSFGRVIERQIPFLKDANDAHEIDFLIDFETNGLSALPEHLSNLHDEASVKTWCRDNRIDAAAVAWFIYIPNANLIAGGVGLYQTSENGSFLPLTDDRWDSMTPEQLTGGLKSAKLENTTSTADFDVEKLPATYGFKTVEGNAGLLQILKVTEKSLTIRYKLLNT